MWEGKNVIPTDKLDNVSFFGDLKLTNWKYENLILLPFNVKTALVEDKTRTEKIEMSATKASEVTSTVDGLVAGKISADDELVGPVSLTMNESDFDKYVKNGNTFFDTAQYINNKLKLLSTSILDSNDYLNVYFMWVSESFRTINLKDNLIDNNKSIWKDKSSGKYQNLLVIDISGIGIMYTFPSEYTVIKGVDDRIWPTS